MSFTKKISSEVQGTLALHSYWTLWTSQCIQSIEALRPWTSSELTIELQRLQNVDETQERRQILLEDSFTSLPRPMQSLLQALRNLKLKMQVHACAYASNSEAKYSTEALRQTKRLCDILSTAKSLRNASLESRLNLLVNPDASCTSTFTDVIKSLQDKSSELRQKIFDLTESSRAYGVRFVDLSVTLSQSSQAVESSEKFRARLLNLAQGPLSSLFEVSETCSPENVNETSLELYTKPNQHDEQRNDLNKALAENQEKLLQLQYLSDKIHRECASESLKINFDALQTIKKVSLDKPSFLAYETPKELLEADTSLQKEIAMVLGTLTMDRASLDSVLRSIKAECQSIKLSNEEEMRANVYKTLKEIQGLLESASTNFLV